MHRKLGEAPRVGDVGYDQAGPGLNNDQFSAQRACENAVEAARTSSYKNATVLTPEMSKRLRQRGFLHMAWVSTSSM